MDIRNLDGSLWQPSGELRLFDPESPDIDLFNSFDQEVTQIGGTPVFYYEVLIQINNTADLFYREDRSKIFNPNPVQLYAYYDPIFSQNYLDTFGVDALETVNLEFNYKAVLESIGHPPKVGSRIFTPHLRQDWVIVQLMLADFKLWSAFKLVMVLQRFQESTTTNEGKPTQKQPDANMSDKTIFGEINKECQ